MNPFTTAELLSTVHTTNLHNQSVYHKLTERQGKAWCLPGKMGADVRSRMASQLARMYPKNGCGVCSATMKLVAYVSPRAELRLLVAPFKVIPIHLIANKPGVEECPCQQFWDPEIKGPWGMRSAGERAKYGGHHPMCQYKATAQRVFEAVNAAKRGGVVIDSRGLAHRQHQPAGKVRPDLMLQIEASVKGR